MRPFDFIVLLGVDAVEGFDVTGDAVKFADDDGEGGAVLCCEDGEEFCQLSDG